MSGLNFTTEQKQRIILRSDSGFGSDYNLDYALDEHWQVLSKGHGGRRAGSLAKKVAPDAWQDLGQQRWITPTIGGPTYLRPVQSFVLRWRTEQGNLKHSTLICSVLEWTAAEVMQYYNDRGSCETQIQSDKGGLKMCRRRKLHWEAQEALILLTDVAHNTLAWASNWMFDGSPLASFGTTRLIEDVLAIPGRLIFENERLEAVELNQSHPHVVHVAAGLERLLEHFGNP